MADGSSAEFRPPYLEDWEWNPRVVHNITEEDPCYCLQDAEEEKVPKGEDIKEIWQKLPREAYTFVDIRYKGDRPVGLIFRSVLHPEY